MEATQHNAQNVIVINESMHIPQLKRDRRVWLYHPPGYNETDKRYPVVYMHDGQNLFDEATAFGEEWGVDETLNSMLAECIIIGIDNSENRLTEYNFRDHDEHGAGEGRQYVDFIVSNLKPEVDANFRTRPEREDTYFAGSSMGGLISLYGAMYHAETFGGAGVFSPSLWLIPDAVDELRKIAERSAHLPQRYYFYGGAQEGGDMMLHIATVATMLKEFPQYSVDVEIDRRGDHSEYHWRNKFADFYAWLAQGSGI